MKRLSHVALCLLALALAARTNGDITCATEYPESRFDPEAQ
jgi:hypothetical protein